MYKQGFVFGLAAALFLTFSAPVFADSVVATVNGDKIYKKDVMEAVHSLPGKAGDSDQLFPLVLDQVINEKLVDNAVVNAKITDTKEYKERLSIIQAQLAKQIYIEKELKDKVSDSKVRAEYDKFKAQNQGKVEIHARHILVPSKEEAVQAIKDLDNGANFPELAKKISAGPTAEKGGDLGWFTHDEMLPAFSEAAFKLKPGTYSKEPVKTQFGYHVIMVEDKRTRQVPELRQVESAIRTKLSQDALQDLAKSLRAKADIQKFDAKGKPFPVPKPAKK